MWLDYALSLPHPISIGLLVVGDPACQNEWLHPYVNRSEIKFIFLVYDSPLIDNKKIFSWPLGPSRLVLKRLLVGVFLQCSYKYVIVLMLCNRKVLNILLV